MNCTEVRKRLLEGDDLNAFSASAEVRDHLTECAECQGALRKLTEFETHYRDEPLPAASAQARVALLARAENLPLPDDESPATTPEGVTTLRHAMLARNTYRRTRWVAAIAAAIAIAASPLLIFQAMQGEASAEPVPQLLALNFEIAKEDSAVERERIYAALAPELEAQLVHTALADPDRELAHLLLHNAAVLKNRHDPLDCAECFNDVADKLLPHVDSAAARNDAATVDRLATYYCAIIDQGVNANLERSPEAIADDGDATSVRLQASEAKTDARVEQLDTLVKKSPNPAKKGVKRMLEAQKKKPHHRHKGGGNGGGKK